MAIPFRVFVVIFVTLVILISVLGAVLPVIDANERTVDDCLQASVKDTTTLLQRTTREFFNRSQTLPWASGGLVSSGLIDLTNAQSIFTYLQTLMQVGGPTISALYIGLVDGRMLTMSRTRRNNITFDLRTPNTRVRYLLPSNVTSDFNISTVQTETTFAANASITGYFDPRVRPWFQPLLNANKWAPLYLDFGGQDVAATVGGPVTAGNKSVVGAMGVDLLTESLRSAWGQLNFRSSGGGILIELGTQVVLTNSWNEELPPNSTTPMKVQNITHPRFRPLLLSSQVQSYLSNLQVVSTDASPLVNIMRLEDEDGSPVIAGTGPVSSDPSMKLVLVLFLFRRDWEKELDTAKRTVIIIIVCFVVVLFVVSVLTSLLLLERPLSNVSDRLNSGVHIADTSQLISEEDFSHVSELRSIQESYNTMGAELIRLKTFLPQHLCQTLAHDNDGSGVLSESDFDDDSLKEEDLSSLSSFDSVAAGKQQPPTGSNESDHTQSTGMVAVGSNARESSTPQQRFPRSSRSTTPEAFSGRESERSTPISSDKKAPRRNSDPLIKFIAMASSARAGASAKRAFRQIEAATKRELVPASISVAQLALRNFNSRIGILNTPAQIGLVLEQFASIVLFQSTAHHGVTTFNGDHCQITFNASTACSHHRRRAVECVLAISEQVREMSIDKSGNLLNRYDSTLGRWEETSSSNPIALSSVDALVGGDSMPIFFEGICAGIASDKALVGNVGCSGMANYAHLSHAVEAAVFLLGRCKEVSNPNLNRFLQELGNTMNVSGNNNQGGINNKSINLRSTKDDLAASRSTRDRRKPSTQPAPPPVAPPQQHHHHDMQMHSPEADTLMGSSAVTQVPSSTTTASTRRSGEQRPSESIMPANQPQPPAGPTLRAVRTTTVAPKSSGIEVSPEWSFMSLAHDGQNPFLESRSQVPPQLFVPDYFIQDLDSHVLYELVDLWSMPHDVRMVSQVGKLVPPAALVVAPIRALHASVPGSNNGSHSGKSKSSRHQHREKNSAQCAVDDANRDEEWMYALQRINNDMTAATTLTTSGGGGGDASTRLQNREGFKTELRDEIEHHNNAFRALARQEFEIVRAHLSSLRKGGKAPTADVSDSVTLPASMTTTTTSPHHIPILFSTAYGRERLVTHLAESLQQELHNSVPVAANGN